MIFSGDRYYPVDRQKRYATIDVTVWIDGFHSEPGASCRLTAIRFSSSGLSRSAHASSMVAFTVAFIVGC